MAGRRTTGYGESRDAGKTGSTISKGVGSNTETRNKSVADTFKKYLNHNTAALALFGTKAAEHIFDANNELVQRGFMRYDIEGARAHREGEMLEFIALLRRYSEELTRLGIVDRAEILVDLPVVGTLLTQCKGRYGTAGRLIKNAVRVALTEGSHALLPHHFFKAVAGSKMLFDDERTNYFENYGATT